MYEVRILAGDEIVSVHTLRARPLHIGRSGHNDVVVMDRAVSGSHLSLWAQQGEAWVEDLGSTNGTFVNGERLRGRTALTPGDEVRLGATTLIVEAMASPASEEADSWLVIENLDAGVRYPIHRDRFRIGRDPDCDLVVPVDDEVTIVTYGGVEIYLGRDDELHPVQPGEAFRIGDSRFVLREPTAGAAATRELQPATFGYHIAAGLSGAGPWARIHDPARDRSHDLSGENRCVLLYLLGRQIRDDLAAGVDPGAVGWCSEDDLRTGVWGREGSGRNLNVLLCRVRKELRTAGFDPWFIEKQRKRVRARVGGVRIDE